ncbi:MAG: CGNR zinc finger domain-containing protein [Nonomuraea sp.]|nr:CGNR zinc finger domain-containing protein [Nonomuraea sp.]
MAPAPFGQAMAGILDIVRTAMDDGCWQRLKACRRPVCRWVFYDASRNRSSHWCSMEVCGNRVKSRSAYQRRRSRTSREPATAG